MVSPGNLFWDGLLAFAVRRDGIETTQKKRSGSKTA